MSGGPNSPNSPLESLDVFSGCLNSPSKGDNELHVVWRFYQSMCIYWHCKVKDLEQARGASSCHPVLWTWALFTGHIVTARSAFCCWHRHNIKGQRDVMMTGDNALLLNGSCQRRNEGHCCALSCFTFHCSVPTQTIIWYNFCFWHWQSAVDY